MLKDVMDTQHLLMPKFLMVHIVTNWEHICKHVLLRYKMIISVKKVCRAYNHFSLLITRISSRILSEMKICHFILRKILV